MNNFNELILRFFIPYHFRTVSAIYSLFASKFRSEEYVEVGAFGQKETEHAQMRERMRLLRKRREEARRTQNSAEKSPMESPQQKSEDELLGNKACQRSFDSPSQSPVSPCTYVSLRGIIYANNAISATPLATSDFGPHRGVEMATASALQSMVQVTSWNITASWKYGGL